MPGDFEDVLVTDGVYVEVMWLDCDGYWDSWIEPWEVTVDREDITHWMPLPEPPEV
jgi:hypothetical protein